MRTLLICLVGVFAANIEVHGQEQRHPVAVHVQSGRTFEGFVDPRTDGQRLWIRAGHGEAVVLRPVFWDRVVSAEVAGNRHSVQDFRELAEQLKLLTPRRPWPAAPANRQATIPLCPQTVRSLYAAAHLENWDADAAVDGYTAIVAPLSEQGAMLPVEGIASATLYGYDTRSGLPAEHWMELARWSQPLRLSCYGPEGGVMRLPLDDAMLDWNNPRSPRRLLKVKLHAPGHGTFEAEIPFLSSRRVPYK